MTEAAVKVECNGTAQAARIKHKVKLQRMKTSLDFFGSFFVKKKTNRENNFTRLLIKQACLLLIPFYLIKYSGCACLAVRQASLLEKKKNKKLFQPLSQGLTAAG